MKYVSFVGLEIHIQLITKSKMFCTCANHYGDKANTNICPVCLGYPGALPTTNEEAVRKALKVAMALNCTINEHSFFDRKNYFYPDMPKNYQITQYEYPFGINGYFDLELDSGEFKRIRIHDVHLEEDAGKMIHQGDQTLLDFNRAGTPLLEIVTEPDLVDGREAQLFIQQFRQMIRYLEVSLANMDEGSLRCDANTSINLIGKGLGTKTEVKNLNSSRFVNRALTHEIKRHALLLERGGEVLQETRLWDEVENKTKSMRTKEDNLDYRYFPEPDLSPFYCAKEFLQEMKGELIELPGERKKRYTRDFKISPDLISTICAEKERSDFFDSTVVFKVDPQLLAIWMCGDILGILNDKNCSLKDSLFSPKRVADLLKMIEEKKINHKQGKELLNYLFDEDKDPADIVRERKMEQISDSASIETLVDELFVEFRAVVAAIEKGEEKQFGFLMGQLMKKTKGKINPQIAKETIDKKLRRSER